MTTVPPTEAERHARAALCRLSEPCDQPLHAAVDLLGAVAVLDGIATGGLLDALRAVGVAAEDLHRLGASLPDYRTRLPTLRTAADLATLDRLGGRLICPGDEEWPARLGDLGRKEPLALWAVGPLRLDEAFDDSVALIGSRAATAYGSHVAADLAASLAERGWGVVSGAAYGIDAAAHRGALAVGGATLAAVASGVDRPYPRGHAALLQRLADEGLVVSEMPPGCAPTRLRFLDRNRLIAALSRGVVVVEAGLRSGARNTAKWGLRLYRPLMAVPGPVTSAMSAGCHILLREGAVCVTDAAEIVEQAGRIGDDLAPERTAPARPRDGLEPLTARVLEAVPLGRPVDARRIAATAGLEWAAVEQRLATLVALGMVEQAGSRFRQVRRGARSA